MRSTTRDRETAADRPRSPAADGARRAKAARLRDLLREMEDDLDARVGLEGPGPWATSRGSLYDVEALSRLLLASAYSRPAEDAFGGWRAPPRT